MVTAQEIIKAVNNGERRIRKFKVTGVPISILITMRIRDVRRLTKEYTGGDF